MAIDFPASPTLNQTFSSGNVNYVWDGTKWTASVTGGISLDKIEEGNTSAEVIDTGSDGRFVVTTEGTEKLRVNSSGRLGIGTTTVTGYQSNIVHLNGSTGAELHITTGGTGTAQSDGLSLYVRDSDGSAGLMMRENNALTFGTNDNERARIDSSGRLLVGTSTMPTGTLSANSLFHVRGNTASSSGGGQLNLSSNQTSAGLNGWAGAYHLGRIIFTDTQAGEYAHIACTVDTNNAGVGSYPGRLVFSTTADGASSPTERMRITNSGFIKVSNTGSYGGALSAYHEIITDQTSTPDVSFNATSTSFASSIFDAICARAANTAYNFLRCYSANAADLEINLRGDGNAFADGSWTGGGADYAEYFEWSDGNPDFEDRRGISVVLDGDKIRPALANEDPIGVISGNPSVVGDAAWNKWNGKYLRDDYGTYIQEDYEVEDKDGNTVIQQRRKLNPTYDPDVEYTSREERPEWDCVGLMGKLRIRKGQPTGSRWIKMRDVSDSVEEWLVR
jgi:hypothetical protein